MQPLLRFMMAGFFSLSFSLPAWSDSTASRIDGVATFLIERANENYLYIFEKEITQQAQANCYFSQTYENLKMGGLRELLLSRQLWEQSISADMETLFTKAVALAIDRQLSSIDVSTESYFRFIQNVEVEYHGKFYPLNFNRVDDSQTLRDLINSFSLNSNTQSLDDIEQKAKTAKAYFSSLHAKDICSVPPINIIEFKQQIHNLYSLLQQLIPIFEKFKANASQHPLRLRNDADLQAQNAIKNLKSASDDIYTLVEHVDAVTHYDKTVNDANTKNVVKMASALREINKSAVLKDDREFKKLSRFTLFFAQISDAEKPDEVNQLLKAYTIPAVSFYEKRDGTHTFFVSSYLGLSASTSNAPANEKNSGSSGIYAPIGLEYVWGGIKQGSIGLLIAPFDFGYPVNLKLNGIERDVKFEEIVAPSISINYGLKDYPLAIGVGYQIGRTLKTEDATEKKIFLHLSFDLPLFLL